MTKDRKNILAYFVMLLIFGALIYGVIVLGGELEQTEMLQTATNKPKDLAEGYQLFVKLLQHHVHSTTGILLLQIISILLTCRLFSWVFSKIGQPSVIGEIVAGIVLGPSLLGVVLPEVSEFLFPPESLANINMLSQFGLILFMFTIGMELDMDEVRRRFKETLLISHTGTIVPFFLGAIIAYFLYDEYANPTTPFLAFALFVGISMSVTAFPVLARIIQEKGMTKSNLGTLTLASAANGDITAWCLLAVIVAIAQAGSMLSAVYNILFSFVYILFMFLLVRPFMRMVGDLYQYKELINKSFIGMIFLLLIASSYLTEILGLHALFGAFMAGVVMPSNLRFRQIMTDKVEDVSLAIFLPLFFVSTGLRTDLGLLNSPDLLGLCILVTVVAIAGKVVSAMWASRFIGESWKDSLYIGAFMSTRGLTELVILSIGYDMGILSPSIFVVLMLMTLATTFMTTPLVNFIDFLEKLHKKNIFRSNKHRGLNRVLFSFARPESGELLLNVADKLFSNGEQPLQLTALHLTAGKHITPMQAEQFEEEHFARLRQRAGVVGVDLETRYDVSSNPGRDICNMANEESYKFLLVGAGISMNPMLMNDDDQEAIREAFYNRMLKRLESGTLWFMPNDLLKDKTKLFIEQTRVPVGVFINRNFVDLTHVLIYMHSEADVALLEYARMIMRGSDCRASIIVPPALTPTLYEGQWLDQVDAFVDDYRGRVELLMRTALSDDIMCDHDFMLVSYGAWCAIAEQEKEALQQMPSTLIVKS